MDKETLEALWLLIDTVQGALEMELYEDDPKREETLIAAVAIAAAYTDTVGDELGLN